MNRCATPLLLLLAVIGYACRFYLPKAFGDQKRGANQRIRTSHAQVPKQGTSAIRVANLPLLIISTPHTITDEPKVGCTVQIVAPKALAGWNTEPLTAGIEIRGGVSRMYPKQSYAFELDAPVQLLDMRTDDDWILNAAYVDISLMRHKLAFDLFRSLSPPKFRGRMKAKRATPPSFSEMGGRTAHTKAEQRFAVASRFIEVYLNGTYRGVYLLMERVDAELLRFIPWHQDIPHPACAYKAVNHSANFRELGHRGYDQKEPNPKHQTHWEPIDVFNAFVVTANQEEFFHPHTGIASRLNLRNAIDFHLLVLVTSNYDGITKNFYLCRDGARTDPLTTRFFFVPWDYDGSFGRNWDGKKTSYRDWITNHLFQRLLTDKTYRRTFQARWNTLRKKQFSADHIHSLIDKYVHTLGDATVRNFDRWPTHKHHNPLPFEQEIAYIKSWTEHRLRWLDQEINRNQDSQD